MLDEPTSALDVSVQAEILNLLRRLHRERKLTMILVSHNLAVVGFLCQRVAVMRNGEVLEQLSIDAVRSNDVQHEYTRSLLLATQGYKRKVAEVDRRGCGALIPDAAPSMRCTNRTRAERSCH